ncbi:MAG TPA: glycosyltransferase family 4 protein [Thermoanaerobaculia bacterium]|nr:glycosyltransferase family 4 protein [Thermoanaerobaculia bacterium]
MRILVVTFGRSQPELGAAQVALNLADALAARGHEVVSWASGSPPAELRGRHTWRWHRERVRGYLATAAPFDAVDLPPIAIGPGLPGSPLIVARSVQPDLLYFAAEARGELGGLARHPLRSAFHLAYGARLCAAVLAGWRRADTILCLGSRERDWMARNLPWTRPKLALYLNGLAPGEREALARVRAGRRPPNGSGVRWLWIGRWARHKGTDRLVRFLTRRAAVRPGDTFTIAGCGEGARRDVPEPLLAAGRVRLVPRFARADLPSLLAVHDAGLFTSHAEGWGISLNEMLESGMPVFATDAGGVSDLRALLPQALRPFPPPDEPDLAPVAADWGPYERRCAWDRIAAEYEATALAGRTR